MQRKAEAKRVAQNSFSKVKGKKIGIDRLLLKSKRRNKNKEPILLSLNQTKTKAYERAFVAAKTNIFQKQNACSDIL